MKKSRKSILMIIVLFASLILMSTAAMAQGLPYASYGGGFDFNKTTGYLTFNSLMLNSLVYDDGAGGMAIPWVMDPYNDPLVSDWGAYEGYLNLGTFQQDSSNQNLFHAMSSNNLSITSVDVYGGGTATTYLTGHLNSFEVINDSNGWHFNSSYNLNNVSDVALAGPTDSEFTNEFVANTSPGNKANLSMSFTFSSGSNGFGASTAGSAGGIIAAPEPVSSVLFIIGGAVIGFNRFRKKIAAIS